MKGSMGQADLQKHAFREPDPFACAGLLRGIRQDGVGDGPGPASGKIIEAQARIPVLFLPLHLLKGKVPVLFCDPFDVGFIRIVRGAGRKTAPEEGLPMDQLHGNAMDLERIEDRFLRMLLYCTLLSRRHCGSDRPAGPARRSKQKTPSLSYYNASRRQPSNRLRDAICLFVLNRSFGAYSPWLAIASSQAS